MFPAVTNVRVPIDQHHNPATIVEDRSVYGYVNILFRIIISITDGGYHLRAIDVIETVINLVILVQFHNGFVGEDLHERSVEDVPLPSPPEIIYEEETTP